MELNARRSGQDEGSEDREMGSFGRRPDLGILSSVAGMCLPPVLVGYPWNGLGRCTVNRGYSGATRRPRQYMG